MIGVVADVVADRLETNGHPELYEPLGAAIAGPPTLVVRLHGKDPAETLRRFVAAVQPGAPGVLIENARQRIDQSMAEPRFAMLVLVTFAALGVLMAAIGLFGVISYSVRQRTREIGVRMTLGATRGTIARLVVGDGVRLALTGIAIGLAGAVAATRVVQSLLYGVSRFDPFAFTGGAVILLAVAVAACAVPMLRATAVDPARAIRAE